MLDFAHLTTFAALSEVFDIISDMSDVLSLGGKIALGCLVILVPYFSVCYAVYYLFSLPLRRQERVRFLIELLDTSQKDGNNMEHSLSMLALSGDEYFGTRFQQLAERLTEGVRLDKALRELPKKLPPEILAMLEVGVETGTLPRILPACRRILSDGSSRLMSASNYLFVVALILNPFGIWMVPFLGIFIFPKFNEIFYEMLEGPLPPLTQFLMDHSIGLACVQAALIVFVLVAAMLYVGSPFFMWWLGPVLNPVRDALLFLTPWRRKRLQRDFSAVLAVLLDAGVPEPVAVRQAARSTSNSILIKRAEWVTHALAQGIPLAEAVERIDGTGEFRWRLRNAAHAHTGFTTALAGWHDSLDARAYQQEQAAAQVITTSLVLLNGAMIALIAVGIFSALTQCVQLASLW